MVRPFIFSARSLRNTGAGFALLLLPIAAPSPGRADDALVVQADPHATTPEGELRLEGETLRLTLDEAVETALSRNLGLRINRYSRASVDLGIQEALGAFDLGVQVSAQVESDESPATSALVGAAVDKTDTDSVNAGVSKLFSTGGLATVGWGATKRETNSQDAILNPTFFSGLDLSYDQPLLRDFGREATRFAVRSSELESDRARETFLVSLISAVREVEDAYWSLVEAREQLNVAEESKRIAVQLHDNNRVRVDVGTLAPLELISSEAGIAAREEEVIRARSAVGNAEDVLKALLRLEGNAVWAASIEPETEPEFVSLQVSLEQALASALANRPELAGERTAQQLREVQSAFERQSTKPQLDLNVRYGFNGVGGDVVIRDENGNIITKVSGGLSDAVSQITDTEFPSWTVGLTYRYPIGNRSAKARALRAELAVEQGAVILDELSQSISTEVRLAVRGLETARQELESARVSVRLQTANLDAERKKFLNGLSTSFQILQVEEDLTAARSREVRAVTGYRRAIVAYLQSTGELLEEWGIRIEG